jgi:two-component system chemotaxis sensor kinase CheA
MQPELDPSLTQDFLTEAAELIQQLDTDLVRLESTPGGPESRDLLSSIFRALHTVKGAAGFLNLAPLTRFAHAAEDALNCLRKGDVAVSPEVIDALLQSVDVLRAMTAALSQGRPLPECGPKLMDQLHAISRAHAGPEGQAAKPAPTVDPAAVAQGRRLSLPSQKLDLLSFMVADLRDTSEQMGQSLARAASTANRAEAAAELEPVALAMRKTLDFFDLPELAALMDLFAAAAHALPELNEAAARQLLPRLAAVRHLIELQAPALDGQVALSWPLDTLAQRIELLTAGGTLPADAPGDHGGDVRRVLAIDGVMPGGPASAGTGAIESPAPQAPNDDRRGGDRRADDRAPSSGPAADQTIRVEVARLEALLNLVGQLVLNKNRFLGITRRMRASALPHDAIEELAGAANELDRLTGNLQMGVMRTRMQPMSKLFERYPRVIRDIARATSKQIELEIHGKETEVDKTVLELLADPLVHILRNSADHGIETPEVRTGSGKPVTGTIRLRAQHQGSHVRVEVSDDGKGLDREMLGRKAVEKGLATAEQVAGMTEQQVFQFIFAAGFSTAETVSDLSGRGVGMDVVRNNVSKLGGAIHLSSVKGRGTTIEVLIPLTVAIMPAMVVGVGPQLYAIPLTTITEIVRPQPQALHSVAGRPVMTLRKTVLPLVDLRDRLGEPKAEIAAGANGPSTFAVVVSVGSHRAGLVVDRLIGQQEVVIKPLDDQYTSGGPFSGATIREDGDVSLILDVPRLLCDAA